MVTIACRNRVCQHIIESRNMQDDTKWRERLKKYRERRGLSGPELAKLAGVSQPIVSQYETGKRPFTQKTLSSILDVLQVSLSDIFCGCVEKKRASDPANFNPQQVRKANVIRLKKHRK